VIEALPEPEGLTGRQCSEWLRNWLPGAPRWPEAREQGFHVLRHTFASVQLEAGESIVTLANWLGHGDPAFTLRTYTHFMPTAGSRGMAAMDAWLRGIPQTV
jgi:integrase